VFVDVFVRKHDVSAFLLFSLKKRRCLFGWVGFMLRKEGSTYALNFIAQAKELKGSQLFVRY
jgi:hypothetical protein